MLILLKGLEKFQESFLGQILGISPIPDMKETVLEDLRVIYPDKTFNRTVIYVFNFLYNKKIRINLVILSFLLMKSTSIIYNSRE